MNIHLKSIFASFSLLIALPVFAHEDDARSTLKSDVGVPVPTRIVQPGIEPYQVGKVVHVRFTITEEGKPIRIQTVDSQPDDPVLAARIIRALRSWEFAPALDEEGRPVAVKVRMPIKVDRIGRT